MQVHRVPVLAIIIIILIIIITKLAHINHVQNALYTALERTASQALNVWLPTKRRSGRYITTGMERSSFFVHERKCQKLISLIGFRWVPYVPTAPPHI